MGELLCNENTAALLASYIVQSDCGDFEAEDYPDDSYLSTARFVPNPSSKFQRKVMENHMQLIGMNPGESDLALLETARRCDYYGVKLHSAKDVEGTEVCLTAAHLGIRVFHQLQCVSTFSWAKIRKLSFKRRKLLIKLHPESYQYYKETIEFLFESRNECKNFWKKCVEHHAFFRCVEVLPAKKTREGRFFSKGSAFRYHGRTQKQLIDYVREHRKRREPFTRPIKSGLSSSSSGRLSKPAFFDLNHPGYATVSERSVNLIGSGASSSATLLTKHQSIAGNEELPFSNVRYRNGRGEGEQAKNAAGMVRMSYFPGELGSNRDTITTRPRNHRHRNSHHYFNNSSAAVVSSERMCLSDMESNDLGMIASSSGGSGGGSMSSRYRGPYSRFVSQTSCQAKPVIVEAVAVAAGSNDLADGSDTDAITSVSLPNVLGDDLQLVRREFEVKCECPPKSASGDNFLELHQPPHDYDNTSEGSYKLSDNEQRSAHSDIQTCSSPATNSVYATTFTAKRVGDVIIKKVVSNSRSTPNTTDDEDISAERRLDNARRRAESVQSRHSTSGRYYHEPSVSTQAERNATLQRRIYAEKRCPSSAPSSYAEYPLHRKLVPIEIDGPNVNLQELKKLNNQREAMGMSKASLTAATPPTPLRATNKFETNVWPIAATDSNSFSIDARSNNSNIVYTSKGTILQKPKIIPDEEDSAGENVYSNVSLTHASDVGQSHMTLAQSHKIPRTHGAVGPLPGKIITKQNLVVTPDGYGERKPKPVVPPKPKNLTNNSESDLKTVISASSTAEPKSVHPVVNLQENEIIHSSTVPELNRPALISVQSEDHPEIQKCHLFNSDIPYVLTMRNISSEANAEGSFSTFKNTSEKSKLSETLTNTIRSSSLRRSLSGPRSPDSFRRRKSLDLVPKKRLPSPSNFSSQDHSLSPTTPESGDVLEYLLRRRNVEKSAIAKRGRRGDARRQTQPVRFNIPPSPEPEKQQISAVSQPILSNDNSEKEEVEGDVRHKTVNGSSATARMSEKTDSCGKLIENAEIQKDPSKNINDGTIISGNLTDLNHSDDFPPPPLHPLPPPPPPPLLPASLRPFTSSNAPDIINEVCLKESTETLPYVDESASSRASFASKDENTDKTPPVSSASSTQRTSTGVLWTDF
ncbi:unnamed protein product [Thelazia callipaeda]|uniref:FERM domain-containing protein n=1 Tax=Thelazia callipaeda TaxID=103827 RepID=A0A0N5DAP7_THECL|nr:unnamed protein product [Thelazia callipaeda]